MKLNIALMIVTLVVLISVSQMMAQEKAAKPEKLGTVHFPVSCSAAAQAQFDRAVALLHSFWVEESEKQFYCRHRDRSQLRHGVLGDRDESFAKPTLRTRSRPSLEKGLGGYREREVSRDKDERERDYIAAIELMYREAETRDPRTRALAYEKRWNSFTFAIPKIERRQFSTRSRSTSPHFRPTRPMPTS